MVVDMSNDPRTLEELRSHYELEKRLASRLRQAPRSERLRLYSELYNELYRSVPFLKTNPATTDPGHIRSTLRLLKPFLGQDKTFLEIGAGNLAVSRALAPYTNHILALDVSNEFALALGPIPTNVQLVISNGLDIPIPTYTVDVAYSSQLMEHLHPDDALEQLKNIYNSLKMGGKYICNTPHRYNGPHDVSRSFETEANGFHLKEYTNHELRDLMRRVGFRHIYSLTGAKGFVIPFPVGALTLLERLITRLPSAWQKPFSRFLPIKILLGIRLVAVK